MNMTISHTTPFLYWGMVGASLVANDHVPSNISVRRFRASVLSIVCCVVVCTMFGISLKKVVKLILFEFHGI